MKEKETHWTEMQILMEKIALFNKFPYDLIVKKNKFRDDPLEIGVVNKKNISFKKITIKLILQSIIFHENM